LSFKGDKVKAVWITISLLILAERERHGETQSIALMPHIFIFLAGFKDFLSELAPLFEAGLLAWLKLEKNAVIPFVWETVIMAAEQYCVRYAFRERLTPGATIFQVFAKYAHRRRDVNHDNRP
jgi:hypothetical protein